MINPLVFLQIALSVLFLTSAIAKLMGLPSSLRHRERMGVPLWLWRAAGFAQLIGVIGLLAGLVMPGVAQWVTVGAGSWLTLIMLGALIAHLRIRDGWQHYLTVVMLLVLSVVLIWASF
jgi:putative oxidoreductase